MIVDDVIATGGSASATIRLLHLAGAYVVGLAAPFFEGSDWRAVLREFAPDWPERVRTFGAIRARSTSGLAHMGQPSRPARACASKLALSLNQPSNSWLPLQRNA